jgi:hypothetical protein
LQDKMLDVALALGAEGHRVFPLRHSAVHEEAKKPAIPRWQVRASSDPDLIRAMWAECPNANPAIATGKGVMVLDVDNKPGKPGMASLELMQIEHADLPPTMAVRTPSGGLHLYFRFPPHVTIRTAVEAFAEYPGIDVRGDGGYVVAPGAVLPAGRYVRTA